MAGLGRRTHYRKHLTDAVLNDLPEPGKDELIAKVVNTRGGNQFDLLIANDATPKLAILPTKFHKLVWVKRKDYVLVQTGTEDDQNDELGGVRYMISHILYKDQVKHLKMKGLWPEDDPEFAIGDGAQEEEVDDQQEGADGIVFQDYDEDFDDDLFVNTNRVAKIEIDQDSSDGSDGE
jgi:probable RNA-binding protein EIF1AD